MNPTMLKFSIVVPTYNRPQQLRVLLQSLAALDYPRERFEVIVVDDGGAFKPDAVIAEFCTQLKLTLLESPHGGPARARQTGIDVARGEFLAFTDDDCVPAANWLKIFEEAFVTNPNCALGGQTINALEENNYSSASQLLTSYLYEHYDKQANSTRFFTTNNIAFPRAHFQALGGLDKGWTISGGEDRDLCERWRRHGYGLRYVPEAVVYHSHALTWRTFWRQHFNYGRGAFRFHRIASRRQQRSVRLEPLKFYLTLPLYPFSQMRDARALNLALLLVLSQVANTAGYVREWVKSLTEAGDSSRRARTTEA